MAKPKLSFLPPLPVLKMISRPLLFSACLFFSLYLSAQTNISGIVNTYYAVIEVIPAKACVRVSNPSGLAQNDRAMIIQMKGVSINTSNSSSFGDTTSLNNAGNYEIGTVCYVRGDSVFFVFMLLNQYTVADKVQLVKIPEYYSALVTDTLKAAPWNNSTGTGGVLAIFVDEDLTLNAPIYADSSGYRGGAYVISSGSCNNSPGADQYYYNAYNVSPQNGSFKGEGAADVSAAYSGGRASPANGGGGGNNHNNGGGGGANLTTGGDGGGNSSSTGCRLPFISDGGKPLSGYAGKKIFAGGGGGAGHANNGYVASNGGGHGGGIIFIKANNLIGNSNKISATGQVGGPAASDGASGGGGGGTIIMAVNSYTGTTTIAANGGQGGTEDDGLNLNRCYGSGGGGSGGVIYSSGTAPAVPYTVTAGAAGPEVNHDGSCNAAVPSAAGAAGQVIPNYTYRSSLVLTNNYCSVLLPAELVSFTAHPVNGQVTLSWKVTDPGLIDRFIVERSTGTNQWIVIHNLVAGDNTTDYSYDDASPLTGVSYYRLKLIRENNAVIYSSIKRIVIAGATENISFYPNPAGKKIFIAGITSSALVKLFDPSAKLLWQKNVVPNQALVEISLPSLSPGIYIIQVGNTSKRLVIH